MLADDTRQKLCEAVAATHEAACPLDIEHRKYGMDVGRRTSFSAAIKWREVCQQALQRGIVGKLGNERISRQEKILGRGKQADATVGRPQIEHIHMARHLVDGIHIPGQIFPFVRKIAGKRVHKAFPAVANLIPLLLVGEKDTVGAEGVHVLQPHTLRDTQIVANPAYSASMAHSHGGVHTRIETLTETGERLQSATDGHILLYHLDKKSFFRKHCSTKQAAQSATYNHN